jgi:hypothetical protein
LTPRISAALWCRKSTTFKEAHMQRSTTGPDLGDIVILLLAGTLSGLRDRLQHDGFEDAALFVADLTQRCDTYLADGEL